MDSCVSLRMEYRSNPWEVKSFEDLYDNDWITLREDQVINPGGKQGVYGKVLFKNRAVAIIPLDQEQHTWIVGQYRHTLSEYSWEIPMGGVPFEEDLMNGAKRELREETGLVAEVWDQILKVHTSNCVTDEVGYCFLAQGLTQGPTNFDETEDLEIKRVPFDTALEMVMEGQITDAISVAGILKLARLQRL
ncbi:MAG: NUDIX hydrolase [Cyclobacteriaceae bacterium]|nr:NUDIX hydrolase [Cyclobacteriaceae bacterium]